MEYSMRKENENKVDNSQSKEINSKEFGLKPILITEGASLAITAGLWITTFALAPIIPVIPTVMIGFFAYMSSIWSAYFPLKVALMRYEEKKKNNAQNIPEEKIEQESNLTILENDEIKKENKSQKYKKLKNYFKSKKHKKDTIEEDEKQNVL